MKTKTIATVTLSILFMLYSAVVMTSTKPIWVMKELASGVQPDLYLSASPPTGLVVDGNFVFLVISHKSDHGYHCTIWQLGKEKMGDYDESGDKIDRPIPCYVWKNSRGGFDGWTDFRGHERYFCGGATWKELSPGCRREYESD